MNVDQSMPAATIEAYIDCCRYGELAGLKKLFHPQAAMYGYLDGELVVATPEMFFDVVAFAPCPDESGEPYEAEIKSAEISQDTATIILHENNYLGMEFKNSFQLLKTDGKWFIVSKLFQSFS